VLASYFIATLNLETSRLQSFRLMAQLITLLLLTHFANYFALNYSPFNDSYNDAFKLQYQELREQYNGSSIIPRNLFDVELINNLINKMDTGKAAGFDDLTSEHLKFSPPIVVCIL